MQAIIKYWDGLSPMAKAACMFICTLFLFSIMDTIAKSLAQRHHSLQVVWARYTSQTVIAFIVLSPHLRRLLRTQHFALQIIRSAFLFMATMCFFTALKFMDMAAATAIFEIAPLFLTAAGFFILGEKVGLRRWIGVTIGLVGAMIIVRPGSEVFSPVALLPICAAACFTGYAISTRFLSHAESPWTSFLYTALIGCIASCFIAPFVWETPNAADAARMSVMGIFGGVGHFLLIRAFTITEASFLAPFGYLALLFNALWAYLFFAEIPDAATWLGAFIIVGAGVYVWYRETYGPKTVQP